MSWENQVDNMAADALAPSVARASLAMVLTLQNEQFAVFHKISATCAICV